MPPKRKRPTRRAPTPMSENDKHKQKINDIVNKLKKCHDKKIESLGTLIHKIFNTTDNSYGISKEVTDAIQKLKPISLTNKELSISNLKTTNNLIKTLQQTVGKDDTPDGLIDSYKQVVEAIVEYAGKIKCPKKKPETDFSEFAEMIDDLYFLEEKYREYYFLNNYEQCISKCKVPSLNGSTIQETPQYQKFLKLYRTKPYNNYNWLENFKRFLTSYRHGDYKERDFSSKRGGLISQLTILNSRLNGNKTPKQGGGSKHHKTTKKRIKGKQTRRNKVKNKTTIKAKNKTIIKAKNKTKKR